MVKQLLDSHGIMADEELLLDVVSQVKQLGERNGCLSEKEITRIINELTAGSRDE